MQFLEDRRVLYREVDRENPEQSIQSAIKIRDYLTAQMEKLAPESDLLVYLRDLREACRTFCDDASEYLRLGGSGFLGLPRRVVYVERDTNEMVVLEEYDYGDDPPDFFRALDRFRAEAGQQLSWISTRYKIDVAEELRTILPSER